MMDTERACWAKQVYLSKAAAKRVARDMSRRHREPLHLYRCPHCRYHHVGHIVPAHVREPEAGAAILITGWPVS